MAGSGTFKAAVIRGKQLLREKRYADALQVCTDEIARGTDDPELRLIAAHALLAQGRHEGAKKEATQVLRLDASQAEAHRILADVACTKGELDAARQHLQRALDLDPDDERARHLYETLTRPATMLPPVVVSPETTPFPKLAKPKAASLERFIESGPIELDPDDLEEDGEGSVPSVAALRKSAHVDPFSGEMYPLGVVENSEVTAMPVSDSMMEELPAAPVVMGAIRTAQETPGPAVEPPPARMPAATRPFASEASPLPVPLFPPDGSGPAALPNGAATHVIESEQGPRGLRTLHDGDRSFPPEDAAAVRAAAAERSPAGGAPEDAWKPKMDAGAGSDKKYEGTLRLPALGELPEEEDAPTVPLLRPSGPPVPLLRLDPLAPKPVSHEMRGGAREPRPPSTQLPPVREPRPPSTQMPPVRETRPSQQLAPATRDPRGAAVDHDLAALWQSREPRPPSTQMPPIGGGADEGNAFEEFGVEAASVPLPQAAPKEIPREVLDPVKARAELAESRKRRVSEEVAPSRKAAPPEESEPSMPGGGGGEGDLMSLLTGRVPRGDDSLAEVKPQPRKVSKAPSGRAAPPVDEVSYPSAPRPLTPEEIERQLASASAEPFGDEEERGERRSKKKKRSSSFRWVMVAIIGLVVGGGGLTGYLWYKSYKFVQGEWTKVREGVHLSTPQGFRQAMAAAERILEHRRSDTKATAAVAMCHAAMSIEFGDDKLKAAKELLEKTKGTDSEWRTAANAYLALMEDPVRAEGYLQKGVEDYPESALLHYLRGRAQAASGASEKAGESYGSALKRVPRYVAARIALADLLGQQTSGYGDAERALDEILRSDQDNIQALIERARLRTRHGKDLDAAAGDARRVAGDLAPKAGRGQVGWAHLVLGELAWLNKQPGSMSTELDEAAKSPPCCDADFRYELGGELMKLWRMSDAQLQLKEALALKPKQAELLQRATRILLELDDVRQAAGYLQLAPARHPETKLLAGRLAYAQGNDVEAAKALKAALVDNKDSIEAAITLALAQARQGSVKEAVAALDKLAADHPDKPEVGKALGRVQLGVGEYAKADAALRRSWKLNKLDPAVPTLLGHVSMRQHDIARAKSRYERALSIRPEYRQARIGLALLLKTTGRLSEARQQLTLIPEGDRGKPDVHGLAAALDLAEGKLDAAKTAIDEAEKAGASQELVARLGGELALARKDGKAAEELLKRAAKLAGVKEAGLLVLLGRAQLLAKKTDDAYDTFNAALKADSGHPEALLELGRIAIKDGEHGMALKRLNDALAKIKERLLPSTLSAAAHTALGQAYLRAKDTGRAITNLQDAMDLDPNAAEPQYQMGLTYDRLDRPQRSVIYYAKALQLDPSLTDAYELLGKAYAKMNDAANAVKYYQEYLNTKPPAIKARAVERELKKLQGQ